MKSLILKLVISVACVTLLLFLAGCNTVMTTSQITTQIGADPPKGVNDISAVTTIGTALGSGNTTGCFADGLPAPAPPPPPSRSLGARTWLRIPLALADVIFPNLHQERGISIFFQGNAPWLASRSIWQAL